MGKGVYVGVSQSASTTTDSLNVSNLSSAFDVTNGSSYYYIWASSNDSGGGVKFTPGNIGVDNSIATTTLTATKALTNVVITGAYYTESNHDEITLTVAGTTVLSAVSGTSAAAQRWSGSLSSGQTIVLTYKKDTSLSDSNENSTYFTVNCNMTVNVPAISNKAKKVKKIYAGVSSKAHKVKKGYIGVNGIAKLLFFKHGGPISYEGALEQGFTYSRFDHAGTSIKNYALFGGGGRYSSSTSVNIGDPSYGEIYDNNLTHSTIKMDDYGRYVSATSINNEYGLFGGGYTESTGNVNSTVEAFNNSLTRLILESLSKGRYSIQAASLPNYALFINGCDGNRVTATDVYDQTLTHLILDNTQNTSLFCQTATSLKNHVIFSGGGQSRNYFYGVYGGSLTLSQIITPISTRYRLGAASNKNHAIFAGGNTDTSGTSVPTTDTLAFDNLLTCSQITPLSTAAQHISGTNYEDIYIFFGWKDMANVYDDNLTLQIFTTSPSRSSFRYAAAASVENYILFGGGLATYNDGSMNEVDIFKIQ